MLAAVTTPFCDLAPAYQAQPGSAPALSHFRRALTVGQGMLGTAIAPPHDGGTITAFHPRLTPPALGG